MCSKTYMFFIRSVRFFDIRPKRIKFIGIKSIYKSRAYFITKKVYELEIWENL